MNCPFCNKLAQQFVTPATLLPDLHFTNEPQIATELIAFDFMPGMQSLAFWKQYTSLRNKVRDRNKDFVNETPKMQI